MKTGYEEITSFVDKERGIRRFSIPSTKQAICWTTDAIEEAGLRTLFEEAGLGHVFDGAPRLVVMQDGLMVGTLPADFDPLSIVSTNRMYRARPGDASIKGGRVVLSASLGFGDFTAIEGFSPS